MRYFLLQTDPICTNKPQIRHWYDVFKERKINIENFSDIEEGILTLEHNQNTVFTGIITHPVLMFQNDVFNIAEQYIPRLPGKKFQLADLKNGTSQVYVMPLLRRLDCLSEESVKGKGEGKYERIVLQGSKIKNSSIFWIQGHESMEPVISLDFAESILRRGARGLHLIELKVV